MSVITTKVTPSLPASPPPKLLVAGLGGGLDIVNASIVHFAAQAAGISSQLGSVRPCPQYFMQNHTPFHTAGTMINGSTVISRSGRYAEPRVSELIGEPVMMLSRDAIIIDHDHDHRHGHYHHHHREKKVNTATSSSSSSSGATAIPIPAPTSNGHSDHPPGHHHGHHHHHGHGHSHHRHTKCRVDIAGLRSAIISARETFGYTHIIFVDGGGDSLILQNGDACLGSETSDPFDGGDAHLLEAVAGLPNIIQAIVSVGLDIRLAAFETNLSMMRDMGAYFGRVHLGSTLILKEDYSLDHILSFPPSSLTKYWSLTESLLLLTEDHQAYARHIQRSASGSLSSSPVPSASNLSLAPSASGPGASLAAGSSSLSASAVASLASSTAALIVSPHPQRYPSHTATVTYHALKGSLGIRRTFVPWEPRTELTHQEFTAAIAATSVSTSIATSITSVAGLGTPVLSPKSSTSGDGDISGDNGADISASESDDNNDTCSTTSGGSNKDDLPSVSAAIIITPVTPSPKSQSSTSTSSQSWRSDAMLAAVSTPRLVPGIRVTNDHAWMYFIDASKVHALKCALRDRHNDATATMSNKVHADDATTPSAPL